jgi:putative DNA primase/helicase
MIPQELKDSSSWVIWKEETRDGKPTKVPYNPRTGKKAAPNNPSTWGTYDEAQSAVKAYGVNGLGFVFSESDAFTGIDLDKCRDSETGEMEPWVKEIISQLNSYTEISPSGTGVHILIKGQLPYGSRRKGKIEMYDTGRYFTMTGHHLEGTPLSIEERQAEIEAFHQEVFRKIQEPQPTRPRPTARHRGLLMGRSLQN